MDSLNTEQIIVLSACVSSVFQLILCGVIVLLGHLPDFVRSLTLHLALGLLVPGCSAVLRDMSFLMAIKTEVV